MSLQHETALGLGNKYSKIASKFREIPLISAPLMCLIIFAHQAVPGYPLVVAANRDEFFPRPTQHADFWSDTASEAQLLAGRDLQAGGSWLGVSRGGKFAAVTNIRDPSQLEEKPRSRGELPVEFLQGALTPEQYCATLTETFDQYAGYNLLVGDQTDMYYVNNFEGVVQKLAPGTYGVSNGLLNSAWPKVTEGRNRMQELLASPDVLRTEELIAMMGDRRQAKDAELPETGMSLEMERQLSSAFIHNTDREYGTRCSTAIIAESDGRTRFNEQNFNADGLPTSNHFFEFKRVNQG